MIVAIDRYGATTRRSRFFLTRVCAAVAALLVVGSCGSTVPHATSGPVLESTAAEEGLDGRVSERQVDPDVPEAEGSANDGAAVQPDAGGSQVQPSADGQHRGQSDGTTAGRIPVAPGTPGVSDSTIKLGFQVDDLAKAGGLVASMGGGADAYAADGDVQKMHQAVIDYVNSQGGIAGRKVVPVWHYEDASSIATSAGRQQEGQRACAAWTEDDPVFAFGSGGWEAMRECAVRTKTVMVALDHTAYPSRKMFESIAPYWYAPHLMVADRREAAVAKTLLADGFFTPGAKVGILIEDQPGIRAGVAAGMKPVLEAAGVDVVAEAVYPDPIDSPWSTYVLRFQSAEVTHVVMSTTAYLWAPSLFMMRASDSQSFRPRWGLASDHYPNQLDKVGAPRAQLARTQGMGWLPIRDVGPTNVVSGQEELCVQILSKAGFPSGPGDGDFCEFPFFLKAALDRADVISPAGMAQAVGRLGTEYVSTVTVDGSTRFAPGTHDGPSSMRSFGFDKRCGDDGAPCFRYTSSTRPIPE